MVQLLSPSFTLKIECSTKKKKNPTNMTSCGVVTPKQLSAVSAFETFIMWFKQVAESFIQLQNEMCVLSWIGSASIFSMKLI